MTSGLVAALDEAAAAVVAHLDALVGQDWSRPAVGLEWTCLGTAEHMADVLCSYANQLAVQPTDGYVPLRAALEDGIDAGGAVQAIAASAWLLGAAARVAGPQARAYHPSGRADADGFCALGVVELCCHGDDIGRALGAPLAPPRGPVAEAVRRLWPDPPVGDAWEVLRRLMGRSSLGAVPQGAARRPWAAPPQERM